jgi:NADPH:quinone reductase-like Zn-dependent oxidoreductase
MTSPANSSDVMTAIEIPSWGGSELLTLVEHPVPTPGAGEVLVAVEAVGMNPVDVKVRAGTYSAAFGENFPVVLGRDFAGTVAAVGEGVTDWAVGDPVFGTLRLAPRLGAYATHVVVRDAALARRPAGLDAVTAAALPVAGLTAWQALVETAMVSPGQRVLVHAGAGGVGHMAVQLASRLGAYVIATASARNADFLKSLGADEVYDYTSGNFEDDLDPVDVVIDGVGNEVLSRSYKVLVPGGIAATLPNLPDKAEAEALGVRVALTFVRPDAVQLEGLAAMVADGRLTVHVDRTFSFAEVREAHELQGSGHVRGKLVLVP